MFRRVAVSGLVGALLLGATAFPAPASAQRASDCGQLVNQGGGQIFTYIDQNKSNSGQHLAGLVNAAIQNVDLDISALNATDLGAAVSVVCVNDSLNQNHLEILKNIDIDVIDDVGIAALNDVNVLAFDAGTNTVYVAP